jgi:hypothetical protein
MPTRSSTAKKAVRATTRKTSLEATKVAINKKGANKVNRRQAGETSLVRKPAAKRSPVKKTVKKTTIRKAATEKEATSKTTKRGSGGSNPLGHLLIAKLFREAGFRGGISSKDSLLNAYSTDESIFSIRPQVILQPKNRQDVQIAAKVISQNVEQFPSLSLTPRAAGTGLGGGSLTDSVVIDMCAHMQKIGEVTKKKDIVYIQTEPGANVARC